MNRDMNPPAENAPGKYRKTYRPFFLWMLLFCVALPGGALLARTLGVGETKGICLVLLIGLEALMLLIHRGGYIYWINGGPSYETARDAPPEQRRRYSGAHLVLFTKALLAGLVYLVASAIIKFPAWLDITVTAGIAVVAAFAALPIHWQDT